MILGRVVFVLAVLALIAPAGLRAEEMTGRQIVDEVSKRHDKAFEFERQTMTLIDKKKNKEERELRRFKRDVDGGGRYLLAFTSPSGVKGTALLTWQYDEKDDDQWLYLPAMEGKLKRIAEGGKRNYFMGTDYTYEDLTSENKDKFEFKRLPDEEVDGKPHFVVESRATDTNLKKQTGYSRQVMWIRQDIFYIMKTDYYDRRERLVKRQVQKKLVHLDGDTWRSDLTVMQNLRKKHITAVKVTERSFDEDKVPLKVFSKRHVTSGQHVQ